MQLYIYLGKARSVARPASAEFGTLPVCKLMPTKRSHQHAVSRHPTKCARVLGGQYIDYVGSWGPAIVGHAHPEVSEALKEQIYKACLDMLFFCISSAVFAPLRTGVLLICIYCIASPITCGVFSACSLFKYLLTPRIEVVP